MHLIHRGIIKKDYKENILSSFKSSFKKNYGIETDIHATKDFQFVCFHDFTLNRIFKIKKSIKDLNYQDLKNTSKNKNTEVPLLKDLLRLSKNKHYLFIKIKQLF
jgi:glycerophosphoryl diester phosphodiesterase